jgi:hypothetical protein
MYSHPKTLSEVTHAQCDDKRLAAVKRAGLGATLTVIAGVVLVVVITWLVVLASPHQPAMAAKSDGTIVIGGKTYNHVTLNMAAFPDSLYGGRGAGGAHSDWVSFSSDNLVVPANSAVTITVSQYDTGGKPNNSYFAKVVGTVGGTETVDGTTVTSVPVDNVGHTFTLRDIAGNAPYLYLNVPLPAVSKNAPNVLHIGSGSYPKPRMVTFTFITQGKGVYLWNCEYPCGDSVVGFGGAMGTYGYMSGTLTVR